MPGEDKWAQYAQPADKWAQYAQPANAPVAGAGALGTPQPAAHPAVNMQSSALSPSLYGNRLVDDAKGLVNPLLNFPRQIATYPGFVDPSKQGGPVQTYLGNPDKGQGLANALTDTAVGLAPAAIGKVPGALRAAGEAGQEAGAGIYNKTGGMLKADFKRGANGGRAYLDAGGGPALSMQGIADQASQLKGEVGQKIGNAIDSSNAVIPTQKVASVLQGPINKGISLETGPGGMGNTDSIENYAAGFRPALKAGVAAGGMTPREVFDLKGGIAKNTNWSDPSQFNLKAIRQQQVGGLSGALSDDVPELNELNPQFQGLGKFAARTADRAATRSSPLSAIVGKGGLSLAGSAFGIAEHNPLMAAAGALGGAALDSVPVKTTLGSGLYRGGKLLGSAGDALTVPASSIPLKTVAAYDLLANKKKKEGE